MDINVFGPIVTGFADDLRRAIKSVPKHEPLELHISSPGGSLAEGVTAYNVLRAAPNEVLAYLDGDAFSAATLLVCCADYAEMPSNVLMMLHEPWVPTLSPCTMDECAKTGRYLLATRNQVVEIYHEKTKLDKTQLEDMLRVETYLTAADALRHGFIDNVTHASPSVQNRALTDYVNVRDRERLASMLGSRKIVRDVADLLKSIGV